MAKSFEGTTVNSNNTYLGPYPIYVYAKYKGTPDETNRKVGLTIELYCYYRYDYSFWWGPNNGGITDITVAGDRLVTNENIRFEGNSGSKLIKTVTKTLYYNKDGDIDNKSIYVHLTAKNILHVASNVRYNLDVQLRDTMSAIPKIKPAYKDTTINITSPDDMSLHRHDQNMTVNWDAWSSDGTTSETWLEINGKKETSGTNSGNSAGSKTFKPSDYNSVGSGSSFTVTAKRKHSTGRNTASSSRTFKTYTVPTIDSVSMSPNPVTATNDTKISWTGNNMKHAGENTTTYLSINGNKYFSIGDNTSWTGALKNYVPVSKDNQNITIKVKREHNTTKVYVEKSFTTAKVLYTPTENVTNIILKENNNNGNPIAPGATVNRATLSYIYVSWTAPIGDNIGIISGYRIVVTPSTGTSRTYYTDATSYRVPMSDLTACQSHTVQVTPYYFESNKYYYGPPKVVDMVLPMSKLNAPVIACPVDGSNWINKNFRVLFTLPTDPDYSSLPKSIQNEYVYNDVEIKINDTFTILWSNTDHRASFSINTVSYNLKVVNNPSLISEFPTSGNYSVKIRVKKNYGNPNSDLAWSSYSNIVNFRITSATYSAVSQYSKIKATHYNDLKNLIVRMTKTYDLKDINTTAVSSEESVIMRSDYTKAYNDLKLIINKVNNWGTFASTKKAVKYPALSTFSPKIEIIEYNSSKNYIKTLYNIANTIV